MSSSGHRETLYPEVIQFLFSSLLFNYTFFIIFFIVRHEFVIHSALSMELIFFFSFFSLMLMSGPVYAQLD